MINVEDKSAYPYITEFKKEPFKSFLAINRRDIGSFYLNDYSKVQLFYNKMNSELEHSDSISLEMIYWFLLHQKFLKEKIDDKKDFLYKYIQSCEVEIIESDQLGFIPSRNSTKSPDIISLYYGLGSLKILGLLNNYLSSKGENEVTRKVKNFLYAHKSNHGFKHCNEKNCAICDEIHPSKMLYYILEIFMLLGIDVRLFKEQFRSLQNEKIRHPNQIYTLLCLKYLDLDSEVHEKDIQFFYEYQTTDGGFSFDQELGDISQTFWLVYTLKNYSWLIEYNPTSIFSFISHKLAEILSERAEWNVDDLPQISKLTILLSQIWSKFIEQIERVIFKQLERESYIDIGQIRRTFGLNYGIEDVILYINLSYNFNLEIIDNKAQFESYLKNLTLGKSWVLKKFYSQLFKKSIVSLSDILKEYKSSDHDETVKLRDDIFPIIKDLKEKNFFKGAIRSKRGFAFRKKYYFYLDYLLESILVSDLQIDSEKVFKEKEKLADIKNDIYNMRLKLSNAIVQIREEIESYLLLDEVDYARERMRYILRNTLMEADFLNENIESSFNEDLKYINLQAALASEIQSWNKAYSILQKRLNDLEKYLNERIREKEEITLYHKTLEDLDNKINEIRDNVNKELDLFRTNFSDSFEKGYSNEKYFLIIEAFEKISQNVQKYDHAIYKISQQINSKEKKIVKKHKSVIDKWIAFKEEFDSTLRYYTDGFQFFNEINDYIINIGGNLKNEIENIQITAKDKLEENNFQDAFNIIKEQSENLLLHKSEEIKDLSRRVKKEIKFKQKLFLLYKYLQEKLERLEEYIIELVSQQVQSLKNKVVEERNQAKIESFDGFIAEETKNFKIKLVDYKNLLDNKNFKSISSVVKGFDKILIELDDKNKQFFDNYSEVKEIIKDSDEQMIYTMQWGKFVEYMKNEIQKLKEEFVNRIITDEIILRANTNNSDKVDLKELADKLNLKCKALIPRIKEVIEISKLQGSLVEDKKYLIVYTEHYYKRIELRNYVESKLMKEIQDSLGKFIALYDSCVKNNTLNVNVLEIQNRLEDLMNFENKYFDLYEKKISQLNIDQTRVEVQQIKENFYNFIENNKTVIKSIKENLKLFINLQKYIGEEYYKLTAELENFYHKFQDDFEKIESFDKLSELYINRKSKFEDKLMKLDSKLQDEIKIIANKSYGAKRFETEAREFMVKKKNSFLKQYHDKLAKIDDEIGFIRNETFRTKYIEYMNNHKIRLSQLLGTLETKVDDYIETQEFKRAYIKVKKREKYIQLELKEFQKFHNNIVKNYNKKSKNFETKNRHLIDDFKRFLKEFSEIITEKVRSLEELIIKSYVDMAIKAVANQFLTIGFLQNELKIKKQQIQKHLIALISAGKLQGKYDPRIGLYYENPEVLKELDEKELEVIKKMNFRVYMFFRRLKNFSGQYGSIIAFFASILTISYYVFRITGENPVTLLIPVILTLIMFVYMFFKKKKEDKV
ncbi:MAG: hypothetical protein EU531_08305 [Promethearchaeota archaeon]|nr:MAG: hypothetical protein EU531_08305 [Candidatus Lokiarchaeota archaeon]